MAFTQNILHPLNIYYDHVDADEESGRIEWDLFNFNTTIFQKTNALVTLAVHHVDKHATLLIVPGNVDEYDDSYDSKDETEKHYNLAQLKQYTEIAQNAISEHELGKVLPTVMTTGFVQTASAVMELMPDHGISSIKAFISMLDEKKGGSRISFGERGDGEKSGDGCSSFILSISSSMPKAIFTQSVVDREHITSEWRVPVDDKELYKEFEGMHKPAKALDKTVVSGTSIAVNFLQLQERIERWRTENPEAASQCDVFQAYDQMVGAVFEDGNYLMKDILQAMNGFDGIQYMIRSSQEIDNSFEMKYRDMENGGEVTSTGGGRKEINEYAFEMYGKDASSAMDALEKPLMSVAENVPIFQKNMLKTIFESGKDEIKPLEIVLLMNKFADMKMIRTSDGIKITSDDESWLRSESQSGNSPVFYESVEQIESYMGLSVEQRAPGYVHQQLKTDNGDLVWSTSYYLPDSGWEKAYAQNVSFSNRRKIEKRLMIQEGVMNKLEERIQALGGTEWGDVIESPLPDEIREFGAGGLPESEIYQCVMERFDDYVERTGDVESRLKERDDKEYTSLYEYEGGYDDDIVAPMPMSLNRLLDRMDVLDTRMVRAEEYAHVEHGSRDEAWGEQGYRTAQRRRHGSRDEAWGGFDSVRSDDNHNQNCRYLKSPQDAYEEYIDNAVQNLKSEFTGLYSQKYKERLDVRELLLKAEQESKACGDGVSSIDINISRTGQGEISGYTGSDVSDEVEECISKHFEAIQFPIDPELTVDDIKFSYVFENADKDILLILGGRVVSRGGNSTLRQKVDTLMDAKSKKYVQRDDVKSAFSKLAQSFENCGYDCPNELEMLVLANGKFLMTGRVNEALISLDTYKCMDNATHNVTLPSFDDVEILRVTEIIEPSKYDNKVCEAKVKAAEEKREAEHTQYVQNRISEYKDNIEKLKAKEMSAVHSDSEKMGLKRSEVLTHWVNIYEKSLNCGRHAYLRVGAKFNPNGKMKIDMISNIDEPSDKSAETCVRKVIEEYSYSPFEGNSFPAKFDIIL